MIRFGLNVLMWGCMLFGISHYLSIFAFGVLSRRYMRGRRASTRAVARHEVLNSSAIPGVTIIMPAYNEEVVIVDTVTSALAMSYANLEICVVSDGSKDRTVEVLVEAFNMVETVIPPIAGPLHAAPIRAIYRTHGDSRLVVVDKAAAGSKGDALNCGLNVATKEWVVVMDGDELVEPDALLRCMTEVMHTNDHVIAVGVSLLPTNECDVENGRVTLPRVAKNPVVGFQLVEYLSAFIMSRPGMAAIDAMPIVSGGFGVFRRQSLLDVGGYPHPHLGEDLEVVVRMHRACREKGESYRVLQVPDAIVWTEFPPNLKILKRQRMRWHRGLRQVIKAHRSVLGRRKYGRFGSIGLGVMYFFEWVAPFIEVIGYSLAIVLAIIYPETAGNSIGLMVATQVLGIFITTSSVWTATHFLGVYKSWKDTARLLMYAVVGQFGFRQLTLYWRMRSLSKKNNGWGTMTRVGHGAKAAAGAPAPVTAPPAADAAVAAAIHAAVAGAPVAVAQGPEVGANGSTAASTSTASVLGSPVSASTAVNI
jgi:cellulose synthase/poly-beta-1,6-N-acetylglucosamine synthase-like glycosyltransferase